MSTCPPIAGLAMPPDATRQRWLDPLELVLLGALWGASFMFQRVAAPAFGAAPLAALRVGLGAVMLWPALWSARAAFAAADRRLWPRLAIVGLCNSAVPFVLFAWAASRAPAGIGAITNSLTPLFAALVGAVFFGEQIGWKRGGALLTGFVGVVVLASAKTAGADIGGAVVAGTTAALLYGISINFLRRYVVGLPPVAVAAVTLSGAALFLLPFAAWQWPAAPIPVRAWGAALLLGVLSTGLAFGLYYRLLKRAGLATAVMSTYLVPLFGVGWAWLLLGEQPTWQMAVAGLLIVGSVVLGQRVR